MKHGDAAYQPGTTMLTFKAELSMSSEQPTSMQALLWRPGDMEGSSNSEGSHETGDSGRYSHDETEMTNLSSGSGSRPASLTGEDTPDGQSLTEVKVSVVESVEKKSQQEVQGSSAAPLQVCGPGPESV